jgi:hypothetical protein
VLAVAAYAGLAELVRGLLIQRGADPNRLNYLGQAPIAGAVTERGDKVVRHECENVWQHGSTWRGCARE